MEEKSDLFLGNRKFSFFMKEKLNLFFLNVQKKMKNISWEEDFIHEINLCYMR